MNQSFSLINFGFNSYSSYHKRNQSIFELLTLKLQTAESLYIETPKLSSDKDDKDNALRAASIKDRANVISPSLLPLSCRSATIRRFQTKPIQKFFRRNKGTSVIGIWNQTLHALNDVYLEQWMRCDYKIFDWSDDFIEFAQHHEKPALEEQIAKVLKSSDLVLTINNELFNRAKELSSKAIVFPNGTNYRRLGTLKKGHPTTTSIAAIKGPIVGYMGFISETRIDVDLLSTVATENPNMMFVLVGPQVQNSPLKLSLPNVQILDPVPYYFMAELLEKFDVCIIPNRINSHTKGNDPIKIYDYLASGRPVISTKTAGIERVSDFVMVASSPKEFSSAIRNAIDSQGTEISINYGAKVRHWDDCIDTLVNRILGDTYA